jgi:hypothetical protein
MADDNRSLVVRAPTLTAAEARATLDRVKTAYQTFWVELQRFHAGRGWQALGYRSFRQCVEVELQVSEQRAYQLLDAAAVRAALEAADTQHVLSSEQLAALTEAHCRVLKPLSPAARLAVLARADPRSTSAPRLRAVVGQHPEYLARLAREAEQARARHRLPTPGPPVLQDVHGRRLGTRPRRRVLKELGGSPDAPQGEPVTEYEAVPAALRDKRARLIGDVPDMLLGLALIWSQYGPEGFAAVWAEVSPARQHRAHVAWPLVQALCAWVARRDKGTAHASEEQE